MEAIATKVTFQKYPVYKDSGLEWLGKIPEHWMLRRFKYLFKEINERSTDGSGELLSVSQYTGVTKKSDNVEDGDILTTASTLEGYKKVYRNDLVSNIMLAWNGSLGFSPFGGITSPAYSIYRLNTGHSERFFHYLVRSQIYKSEFKRNSSRVIESRLRLYTDDFFSIWSLLPPLPEQTAIAAFLDDKTAKIDRAIAQKEKMIALLKERKQIIIQNAVTKGLDPNAKMKHSGVEWIGEIPEHWAVEKLKHIFFEKKKTFNPNLNCGSISYGEVVYKDDEKIPESTKASYQELLCGEFLINPLNLNYDLVSLRIGLSEIDVVVSPGYLILKPHKIIGKKYFKYLLHRYDVAYMKLLGAGVRQTISFNHISNSLLVIPTISEQNAIVAHVETQSAQIDKAIKLQEQQIEKLKELKSTLIDSAVTGKIKVPGV